MVTATPSTQSQILIGAFISVANAVSVSYLIRGIPVPESLVAHATVAETRAFAQDIASHVGSSPGVAAAVGRPVEAAVYSRGNHIIVGIPAAPDVLIER